MSQITRSKKYTVHIVRPFDICLGAVFARDLTVCMLESESVIHQHAAT